MTVNISFTSSVRVVPLLNPSILLCLTTSKHENNACTYTFLMPKRNVVFFHEINYSRHLSTTWYIFLLARRIFIGRDRRAKKNVRIRYVCVRNVSPFAVPRLNFSWGVVIYALVTRVLCRGDKLTAFYPLLIINKPSRIAYGRSISIILHR